MRKGKALLLLAALAVAAGLLTASASEAANQIWYVNAENKGGGNGLAWQTAFDTIQGALAKSRPGDEIWVAKGTYYPHASDRNVSFDLKKDVALYGGFSGRETKLDQRDYRKNVTTLSGNIGKGDKTRNTVTIVKGADNAVLDGFTVSDAYATDEPRMHLLPSDIEKNDMSVGGGMRNFRTSPIVRNCLFKNNHSPKGGAVYNMQDSRAAQALFVNVTFSHNTARMRGGAVSNDLGAMPTFINCRFIGNACEDKGGALYNDFAASPILLNCLFQSNRAMSAGAIGNDGGSAPLLVNVTIDGNEATSGMGGGLYQGTGIQNNPVVINSSVDNLYNWHEDIVVTLNSAVPENQIMPLADFMPVSNMKGAFGPDDLARLPGTKIGFQTSLDGSLLLENTLVKKLIQFYKKNGGAIRYQDVYSRPEIGAGPATGTVVYAAPRSQGGTQDGNSWETAFTDLQQAINKASLNKASVWIRAGTYAPSRKGSQIAAFILYDYVKLYGGFAGTEKSTGERDIHKNHVILSAKTADGTFQYPHVLYGANNAVLDGLTIRDGKADGLTYNGKGGGLLAYHAGKTYSSFDKGPGPGFVMQLSNCRFVDNQAREGGGIYAFGKANLSISHTTFQGNKAMYGGAVMDREGNKITYDNCSFISNDASVDGGGAYEDYGSHASFKNSAFDGNRAQHEGGALYVISRASQLEATEVTIEKSRFDKNSAPKGPAIFNADPSKVTIKNCVLDKVTVSGNASFEH